jgi:hypothetical protein
MFLARLRQGIGFDIEYNEDVCHIIVEETEKGSDETFVAFAGIIVKLPFVVIYLGEFFNLEDK